MRNKIIIEKIVRHADRILAYCRGVSYEKFSADAMLSDACVFNLGQIGELANQLDDDFTRSHQEIPWRSLYGLRNRIVHDYDGVNMNLIWTIIAEDLKPLRDNLSKIPE
ncbi:HepT-like ribonuclease domain-containing protein [Cloacibacillus sp. An23]|uniref:HepT-like ribonuclease domain-containing protein n=1 Tax=Cloacibacillus sp. An23 TaxID=1965591 RepID=UPI000B37A4FA|nr:HepT-like ribonuclease domain-containing protein [Cloacibacillus sp. An23]OUO94035.1 hypothetical protein B5F39_05050 [Cloacibacillus sp. An23]